MNKVVQPIIGSIGFLAIIVLFLAGLGYKSEMLGLGEAFALLRYSAIAGLIGAGLVIFWLLWKRPSGSVVAVFFVSAALGLCAFYLPYRQTLIAQQVPAIHDITTNIDEPPVFVAIAPLRAEASNPAEYSGAETAALQREAYPDLMTLLYSQSSEQVFVSALAVVEDMGWELVEANEAQGRIEATDTTQWFGFKDDVVVRLREGSVGSTTVDVRSKSRVGRSDIGVNAKRIRAFRDALNEALN